MTGFIRIGGVYVADVGRELSAYTPTNNLAGVSCRGQANGDNQIRNEYCGYVDLGTRLIRQC